MKGYLYKVTNINNNKVYIGKTYLSILERWKRHLYDTFRTDKLDNTKFHNAIRKYGANSFKIEPLGEFETGELEQKEVEYIELYDSYNNGYNSTIGGDGNPTINLDEEIIRQLFDSGYSLSAIALELNTGTTRKIAEVLSNLGYNIDRQTACYVEQYDTNWNLLNTFESKKEAWKWLVENYKSDMKRATAYYRIKQSSDNGGVAFGYRWKQYETDIVLEGNNTNNIVYFCDAIDDNGNAIIKNQRVSEVAKQLA